MARKKKKDITTDKGMTDALNQTWEDFESGGDRDEAMTRTNLIGRGISIRNLRLREKQFAARSKK